MDGNWGQAQAENPFDMDNVKPAQYLDELNDSVQYANNHYPGLVPGTAPNANKQGAMITAAASVACPKLNALNHNVLDGFTTGTQHIIQLNHPEVLQKFYMTKIPSKVADVIDNSLSELPLRGEFVLTLDKNCRVTLDWRSMSIFNFHRLLKILRQTTTEGSHVGPTDEAEALSRKLLNAFDELSIPGAVTDKLSISNFLVDH